MPAPLRPKQSLGQNFLRDPNTARKIVAALVAEAGAHVVEIGPGTGALTGFLAERFDRFTALEVDARAVAHLRHALPRADIRHEDVLEADWRTLAAEKGGPLHVIGNLPYNLTSPILFGLLDAAEVVAEAVTMMQLEVAERLVAVPRTKAYGILSVAVQLQSDPALLFRVPRTVFYPRPDVTSAVVRLDFARRLPDDVDPAWLRRVVRTAFGQRRKTLRNSLKPLARGVPLPNGWDRARAEELAPEDFLTLARHLDAA